MASQSPEDKSGRPGATDGSSSTSAWKEQERRPSKAWGIIIFGLIGATTATFAISQVRRSMDWFYTQLSKVQTTSSWRKTGNSSSRGSFSEEARKRYYQRMQQEYEEEQERVQRIRHMQSVFNRERNKFRNSYESWRENGPPGGYNYIPRDDWYWQADTSHSEHRNRQTYTPAGQRVYPMSHHYAVLGLDRSRATPYTDAEVKTAFRTKAMEVHPDQNQDDRESAEERFKEVVKSYEAIKLERKNG
ncbi:hypothetical protein PR202_gb11103 [Eleusine coracana subsp. coracana]|uniref:J domain-containing protein n=1 Tax=Eleusine coracana subsp. coracana TaxID=191504 RepID=A0AAV5EJR3_ELECO|nr:hypothetical protein QOZ80_3BG0263110 [Eleusine coracana subsp. coracana]GJN23454.1 hypothetical protein PR202_gb11103 [Eleusine coracana subsp. coracana]